MTEFDPVVKYVQRYIELSAEEQLYLASLLRITRVKKKQYIVQPDFVCRYRSYVVSGAMRAYLIDKNGDDHTIAFAVEDWWISDYNSYIFQTPASMFVGQFLKELDCLLITIDFKSLCTSIPVEDAIAMIQKLVFDFQTVIQMLM